jgi:branched-chain amino acid transport system substrate-binding protein
MIRRMFALCLLFAFASLAPVARGAESFTIGVMNDQSGPYADLAGPGSVEMARMAIEDLGGSVLGKTIELLVADHQTRRARRTASSGTPTTGRTGSR